MIRAVLFVSLLAYSVPPGSCQPTPNDFKRGLIKITENSSPSDDRYWTQPGSPLTWYYNYRDTPTAGLSLQFVPMLWGASSEPSSDTTFLKSIVGQLSASPRPNITHILSFNEPDGPAEYGGSSLTPEIAAQAYVTQLLPLRAQHDLFIGLPAITGSDRGLEWLRRFNDSCIALTKAGCQSDFVSVHWYGNFGGLASFMGQMRAAYPGLPVWVTEIGLPNADLEATQAFYNVSREYFERLDYVERYSWFGGFRSDVSNIGPNSAFLTGDGSLTDIGSWYLGGGRTGNVPNAANVKRGLGGRWAIVLGFCMILVSLGGI